MSESSSVSIGFNTKEAQQEIKSLGSAMKQTQNEFKTTDATLKTTGSSLDRLKNKYQSLSTQLNQQSQITAKYKQLVEQASTAQEAARQRLEKANAAYEKGKTSVKGNKEELQKLKDEVQKAQSAVNSADKTYEKYNTQLSKSKTAEANLRNELQQTGDALKKQSSYIEQVKEKYTQLNDKTATLQKGLTSTGKVLTATVTAPILAAAAYAVKSYTAVDEGMDVVIKKTGATGEAAEELKTVYKDVAKEIPDEFTNIGAAVGEINTRFHSTGSELEDLSEKFLKFAKINDTDVNNSVGNVHKIMTQFNVDTSQTGNLLGFITSEAQRTGIGVDTLMSSVQSNGSTFKEMGLNLTESISLLAEMEANGVNSSTAVTGLKKAVTNYAKDGKSMDKALDQTIKSIKNAKTETEALTTAQEIFGTKGAAEMVNAIRDGRLSIENLTQDMSSYGNVVDDTYTGIIDGKDEAKLALQTIQVSMYDLGNTIVTNVAPAVKDVAGWIGNLVEKFGELDEGTQSTILKFALVAAAAGPVLSIASKGVKVVNGGISAVSKIGSLFKGTATAATAAGTASAAAETAATAAATAESASAAAIAETGTAAATAAGSAGLGGLATTLGVVGIAAAGIVTTIAISEAKYKKWYQQNYRWAESLEEGNEKLTDSANKYKELSEIQDKIKKLKIIIENPESSKEEVEDAKTNLNELVKILNEKYQLNIEVSDDVKDIVEEASNKVNTRTQQAQNDLETDIANQLKEVETKKSQMDSYESEREKNVKLRNEFDETAKRYSEMKAKLADIDLKYDPEAEKTSDTYTNRLKALQDFAEEYGYDVEKAEFLTSKAMDDWEKTASDNKEKQQQIIDDLDWSYTSTKGTAQSVANTASEILRDASLSGDSEKATKMLQYMGRAVKSAKLDLTGYAEVAAQAMSGVDNLSDAWEKAANGDGADLDKYIERYVWAMQEFGASATETATGAALLQNGFTTLSAAIENNSIDAVVTDYIKRANELGESNEEIIKQAAALKLGFSSFADAVDAGQLDAVNEQVNDLGKKMEVISGEQRIELSVNGDMSIIDETTNKVTELRKSDGTSIKITAEGNVEMLDDAGNRVAYLESIGAVELKVNAETGNLEALDSAGNAVANLTQQGEDGVNIDVTANTENAKATITDLNNQPVEVKVDANTKSAEQKIDTLGLKTVTVNVKYASTGFAEGTTNAPGGPAIINDEKGVADPTELVKHKGKYYLFKGRDILVNLSKGDSVYTAAQTKQMLSQLPHYATGTNNEAFTAAKEDFEYRQKTSVVTDAEALLWWKNILEEYASDTDVVKEANIEIYELTNQINEDAIKDYKDRIKNQESASKSWMDYEIKMHNLSVTEQIEAYGRMDDNYYNTLQEMIANTDMTAEELEEVWNDYYETLKDHEMKVADLRKKNLEELHEKSLDYISERTYYNDWESYEDTPEEAYERIKQRNEDALAKGEITVDEYTDYMTEAGQKLYEGRLSNSKKWLENQKKYGAISDEEYRAGLKRVKAYTEEYYKAGLISGQYYYDAMDEANSDLFDNMSSTLENYINEYYDAQQEMLSARRDEIEAEYDALETEEKKADREKQLEDLQAQYDKYQNAVTVEGKKKLQEIQDEIDSLKQEEKEEEREAEKQARLDEIDAESEELEKEQENTLKGVSKYTAQALDIISGGNAEMTAQFNKVVENYNSQQAQLAQSGYETISKIVDMTNIKLAELGQSIQPQSSSKGDVTVTVNQNFNNQISDDISAAAYGKYASSSLARNLSWINELMRNGG